MAGLGLNAYRFSVSWPRIMPDGCGAPNPAGLAFYDRLVDALLERGITPFITLYHWDLPQALQDAAAGATARSPAGSATTPPVMGRALGDRVAHWITFNEPCAVIVIGHACGIHAPGCTDPGPPQAAHHLYLAHGDAVRALRAAGARGRSASPELRARIGGDSDADSRRGAALRRLHQPLVLRAAAARQYPADVSRASARWPELRGADVAQMSPPHRFPRPQLLHARRRAHDPTAPLPARRHRRHAATRHRHGLGGLPGGASRRADAAEPRLRRGRLYITENGAGFDDRRGAATAPSTTRARRLPARPPRRRHRRHRQGVDLRGYFVWSLLDNFEWAFGYSKRFGIVHVDFASQQRTSKASGRVDGEVISEPRGGPGRRRWRVARRWSPLRQAP